MRRFPGISRIIMRSLIGKPATLMYPKRKRTYTAATRGWVENDIARCIFCGMCQRNCPTDAIVVRKEKRDWQIDSLRCCQCRRCVEVCPVSCLSMHDAYFPPVRTRAAGLYLVVGLPKETPPSPMNTPRRRLQRTRYHRENLLERQIPHPRSLVRYPVKRSVAPKKRSQRNSE
jgi:formate hydrogenlyase subunit 6/NADH:ubiquinone oxidoreductase subunit I